MSQPVISFKSEINVPQYFDKAINLLSQATNDVYINLNNFQFKVNYKFQYIYKHFNKVDKYLNKIDKYLNKINKHLKQIDKHLNNIKCYLKIIKNNMSKQFKQNLTFQRN